MRFYKINVFLNTEGDEFEDRIPARRNVPNWREAQNYLAICDNISDSIVDRGFLFLSSASNYQQVLGLIIRNNLNEDKIVSRYLKESKLDYERIDIKETTFSDLERILNTAERYEFIEDTTDIYREYDLEDLLRRGPRGYGFNFEEKIIKERKKESIYLSANSYFANESFLPELDRIYAGRNKKAYGHPVDYMIESDNERTQQGVSQLLLQALYDVRRIENLRYSEFELKPDMSFPKKIVETLYNSCVGGAVIVSIGDKEEDDKDIASGEYYYLEDFCKIVRRHCRDVLTIICLPQECTNMRILLYENLGNCTFVEIKEEAASDEGAITYLKDCAKNYKIRTDKMLFSSLEKRKEYFTPELNNIFDEWYSKKIKNTVYSQYKDIQGAKTLVKAKKPKGTAYEELESMIGLSSAKEVLNRVLDSYKAQILYKDKGMPVEEFCNHMIFTGNPGTAKTTVARLFARILKDNNVLSKGHIVEVGRGDLVGKYVGWTAPTVQRKFKEARGGILFIDEAYSLVDDRGGSFGDEAINTIVQEMENNRSEVIVIFAGYPDKMESFLEKNPGLRSRIAHHIHFEDYNTEELCSIAEHIAKSKGLVLDDGAVERIRGIVDKARLQSDFGNGRYVRNLIEKARMAQNSRLMQLDYDSVTADDIKRICEEDIKEPVIGNTETKRRIGFVIA